MSGITTHVLDTALGKPGVGIKINLEYLEGDNWVEVGSGMTNSDGRAPGLLPESFDFVTGTYKIKFDSKSYFDAQNRKTFYPHAEIVFIIEDNKEHFHVPLLISGFGYSTYRGS